MAVLGFRKYERPTPPAGPVPARPNPPKPPKVKFSDLVPFLIAGFTLWATAADPTTDSPNHTRTSLVIMVLLCRDFGRTDTSGRRGKGDVAQVTGARKQNKQAKCLLVHSARQRLRSGLDRHTPVDADAAH